MMEGAVAGVAAVLLGGALNGSFVAPLKKIREWRWEHAWFVYSVSGLILVPWLWALLTLPSVAEAIAASPPAAAIQVLLFGFGWGIGSVLFGLGVDRMGLALGYGLILGLIAPIGTLLPLLVLYPEKLFTRQGVHLLAGTAIVLGGIGALTAAGRLRERMRPEWATRAALPAKSFLAGVLICVLSGIFSPMLNFAFVFGEPLREAALAKGASARSAANALWALTLTAGFVPNAGYAGYLMLRNRSLGLWRREPGINLLWASLMGVLCYGSFMVYGFGASGLGRLGGIVGWPLFMSMSLITSNTLGWITGEWKEAPTRAARLSLLGVGALIAAIVIIALGREAG